MGRVSRILVLGIALLVACDPPFDLDGRVVDSAGRPAVGLTVRLSCDGVTQLARMTDARGMYAAHEIGWYPDTCVVEVLRETFVVAQLPIMPLCQKARGDHACSAVHADVRLP